MDKMQIHKAYFTANQIHTILSDTVVNLLCLYVNSLLRRDITFRAALKDGLAFGSLKS